jgi:hypothetical protein
MSGAHCSRSYVPISRSKTSETGNIVSHVMSLYCITCYVIIGVYLNGVIKLFCVNFVFKARQRLKIAELASLVVMLDRRAPSIGLI